MGIGWSLSGLSTISRTRATYAVDGFNGVINYDSNDRFALDGQSLINITGGYGQPGTVYYTEAQSWRQVKAGSSANDGFTVIMKNGVRVSGTQIRLSDIHVVVRTDDNADFEIARSEIAAIARQR